MLDNAWIIPLIPAASFFLILFFGKRLPRKGHEIGIPAILFSFVWSCAAVVQWIGRPEVAEGEEHIRHSIETEPHVIFTHEDDTLGPAGTSEWQAFVRDPFGNTVGLVSFERA